MNELRWLVAHAITLVLTLLTYLVPPLRRSLCPNPARSASNSLEVSVTLKPGRKRSTPSRKTRASSPTSKTARR
jgi:hypothetical protein